MQAAALDREIYDPSTLSKSHTTTPYFDMMGLNLGTEDILDTPATAPSPPNVWKTPQQANQLALLGTHHPNNDDWSLISNNDASLATTLATFGTNLTTVVTAMFDLNNKDRERERKEYDDRRKIEEQQRSEARKIDEQQRKEAEEKRETQRKEDNTRREQLHRDDLQRMETLEERRDRQRAADLLASQQVMMQMM